mmetsp:Transcript_2410/g.7981  ORF Transcript_2410/g.7981 Transcript_2410/m.7981 type:complete len:623 (-) Transcript_2410:60-1928(-)
MSSGKQLNARLDSLGRKVTRLEITTKEIVAIRDARAYARETESTFTAEQERAEKSLLAQWLRSFVHRLPKVRRKPALEHAIEIGLGLDAVDFAFCRYALNIAICSSHVSQQKIISSRIPNVLVGMVDGANASMMHAKAARNEIHEGETSCSWLAISDASALVVGPSLMALAHIARADGPAREAIAEANGIVVVISCMTLARQPAVLTQACRALGALALLPQNRTRIAAAGGIGALVKLLAAARPPPLASGADAFTDNSNSERREDLRVTETVQETALAALTNLTKSSEANRQLVAELGGVVPMVSCALFARDGGPVRNAAQALANVAFGSHFAVAKCLMARADAALCAAISATDLLSENSLLEAAYRALANIALDEASQSGLAAGDAMLWCVRGLNHCRHVLVLRAAAHATAAIAYKSLANKARFAQLGALAACLRVTTDFGAGSLQHTEHYVSAVYATSLAACTLLSFHPNHLIFEDCCGVETYAKLCANTEHMELLHVGAMVIATVTPTAHDRWEAQAEGRIIHFETTDGLQALIRCTKWVFSRTEAPTWLHSAISALEMGPDQLEHVRRLRIEQNGEPNIRDIELFPREELFEEFVSPIQLDHVVAESPSLRDLAFRLY